jgi:DNA invertase Pin-like site-specific DNA recombinase
VSNNLSINHVCNKSIGIILTGFDIDTCTPHGCLALQTFAALAEYERALITERIHAGIAAARARGIKGGRRPKLSPEQQRLAVDMAPGGRPATRSAILSAHSQGTHPMSTLVTSPQRCLLTLYLL